MIPERTEVIGIGAATWDDLWVVPDFSATERVAESAGTCSAGGGPVATALCVLGSLGHRVALIDVCGDDAAGQAIRNDLERHRVATTWLQTVPEACSARSVILVRAGDGARQIAYLPSTAGEPRLDAAMLQAVAGARLLHLNGRHAAAARAAVARAQAAGVTISFDGGAGRCREELRDLVLASHLRIVAREFAEVFTGRADLAGQLDGLLAAPALLAVVTDGVHGSHVALPDGTRFHQPAFPARPLVDTTGCGDVYHGAFLHGWLAGWPAPKCAEFASRLAARTAEGLGGRHAC